MAKPQIFNEEASKVLGFLIACRLYIRIKIKNISVEEHVMIQISKC